MRDIKDSLIEKLDLIPSSSIECAFACWMYPLSAKIATLPDDFSVMNYSNVAQLGYLINCDPVLYEHNRAQLEDGIDRVMGRPVSSSGISSFHGDTIALLGLAIGAEYIGGETKNRFHAWLKSFVKVDDEMISESNRLLLQAALRKTDPLSVFNNFFSDEASYIILALESRGILFFQQIDVDKVYQNLCKRMVYEELDIVQIASILTCVNYMVYQLPAISISRPNDQQVLGLLNNIASAFKRWVWEDKAKTASSNAQKWDVQNEYHVQSLLYFMLAPIFPDIESEFYPESVGQLNSRADIGLPSLNLIIEVKFLRKGKKFQSIIEEVAADSSLYFKKDSVYRKKYSRMLVFLWDNARRQEEHNLFINGVNSLENIAGAVVISRPGILMESTQ